MRWRKGQGETIIDGMRFAWSRGDVIAVPAWRPHSHIASVDSVLLRVTDEPLLKPLDLLREEIPLPSGGEGQGGRSHH